MVYFDIYIAIFIELKVDVLNFSQLASMSPFFLATNFSSRFQLCFDFTMLCGSLYCPFKGSPAYRADYLELNCLDEIDHQKCSSHLFPMKYCGWRWLEKIPVIDRIIKVLPKLKVYPNKIKKDLDTATYNSFKAVVSDVMLPVILEF